MEQQQVFLKDLVGETRTSYDIGPLDAKCQSQLNPENTFNIKIEKQECAVNFSEMYLCFKLEYSGTSNKMPSVQNINDLFTVEAVTINGNDVISSRGHASSYGRNIVTHWLTHGLEDAQSRQQSTLNSLIFKKTANADAGYSFDTNMEYHNPYNLVVTDQATTDVKSAAIAWAKQQEEYDQFRQNHYTQTVAADGSTVTGVVLASSVDKLSGKYKMLKITDVVPELQLGLVDLHNKQIIITLRTNSPRLCLVNNDAKGANKYTDESYNLTEMCLYQKKYVYKAGAQELAKQLFSQPQPSLAIVQHVQALTGFTQNIIISGIEHQHLQYAVIFFSLINKNVKNDNTDTVFGSDGNSYNDCPLANMAVSPHDSYFVPVNQMYLQYGGKTYKSNGPPISNRSLAAPIEAKLGIQECFPSMKLAYDNNRFLNNRYFMFVPLNKSALDSQMKERSQDLTIRLEFENTHRSEANLLKMQAEVYVFCSQAIMQDGRISK